MTIPFTAAVEGLSDQAVLEAIFNKLNLELCTVYVAYGKPRLDINLPRYNSAARFAPWIVLRDLDHDAPCAPQLVKQLLPNPSRYMVFRIAKREIESWLMGDIINFCSYFSVARSRLPRASEDLADPKQSLINIMRRSRKRVIREDMVPRQGSGASEGIAYAFHVIQFVLDYWDPSIAAQKCDSLRRCMLGLQNAPTI